MKTSTKREVLEYAAELLREWGDGNGPHRPHSEFGICEALSFLLGSYSSEEMVRNLSPFWHLYSGNKEYPVKGRNQSAVDEFWYGKNYWANTSYGDDRRDLCHFLADEIEEYLETGEC